MVCHTGHAEELFKTLRVSFQNKFEKLVHLVGFIIREKQLIHSKVTLVIS